MTIDYRNWQSPLDWPEIWQQFDKWFDRIPEKDDWAAQKRAIQRIVNKAIKEQKQKAGDCARDAKKR